jgi:hypothetical protein
VNQPSVVAAEETAAVAMFCRSVVGTREQSLVTDNSESIRLGALSRPPLARRVSFYCR